MMTPKAKSVRKLAIKWLSVFLAVGFLAGPLPWAPSQAQARDRRGDDYYSREMPRGYGRHDYRGKRYYSYGGRYYRHDRGRYVAIRPPRGMHVRRLPLGYTALVIAGITYFAYLGTYYRPAPDGYVVVAPPVAAAPAPAPAQVYATVAVNVAALNLRQGPGRNYMVVGVVNQGDVLEVVSQSRGWLYVRAPNGQTGWVVGRFTSPAQSGAAG